MTRPKNYLSALFSALLLALTVVAAQRAPEEKLWEGRYVRLNGNVEVSGSGQTWVLSRRPEGGYLLRDEFFIGNPAAALVVGLAGAGASVDRKLLSELQREIAQKELVVRLDAKVLVQGLSISGERMVDKKSVVVADCSRKLKEVQCKGVNGNGKLKTTNEPELMLSFPFPMLLAPLIVRAEKSPGRAAEFKAALIEILEHRPAVQEADARIQFEGDEAVTIGDRTFTAGKYRLAVQRKGVPLDIIVWSSKNGLILAMEDGLHFPGERIALVEYKRHAAFP